MKTITTNKQTKSVKPKVKFSISAKIITSIVLVTLFVTIAIGAIVGIIASKEIGNQSEYSTVQEVQSFTNEIDTSFKNIEAATETLAAQMSVITDVDRLKNDPNYEAELNSIMDSFVENFDNKTDLTRSVYIYYNFDTFGREIDFWYNDSADGQGFIHQPGLGGEEFYSAYHAWYSEPMSGKSLWTPPYMSVIGAPIASYVTPLTVDNEIVGMVGMDLYLGDIQDALNEKVLFDSGYLYLMQQNGDFVVHQKFDWVDGVPVNMLDIGDFEELLTILNSEESGITSYIRDDGAKVFSAYSHIGNGWILGSSIPEEELTASVNSIITLLLIVAFLSIAISIVIAAIVGKTISKPILEVVEATAKISEGDLTVVVQSKAQDETKLLSMGLNNMTTNVRKLISEAKVASDDMVRTATDLAAMAEETNATVEQVSSTVNEISTGTQETANEAEKGALIANRISENFNLLISKSKQMIVSADSAIEVNKVGMDKLEILRDKSTTVSETNTEVVKAVENLEKRSNAITEIIATISSIATQTNLLALNASIEAARAGAAGKGFAVVAEEIRKLAEDSSSATNEISSIVFAIQKESNETVSVMNNLSQITHEQNSAITDVDSSLNSVFTSVEQITSEIESVSNELNNLYATKDELITSTSNISAVSEETAAATEEVNASMDEQTRAIEEVALSSEKLNSLSIDLSKQISRFKI